MLSLRPLLELMPILSFVIPLIWSVDKYPIARSVTLTPQCWWGPGIIAPAVAARCMMTSSNGKFFRFTGPLCGEFTGHRWIPRTKASDAELWCSNKRLSKHSWGWWFETPSHSLWRHGNDIPYCLNNVYRDSHNLACLKNKKYFNAGISYLGLLTLTTISYVHYLAEMLYGMQSYDKKTIMIIQCTPFVVALLHIHKRGNKMGLYVYLKV